MAGYTRNWLISREIMLARSQPSQPFGLLAVNFLSAIKNGWPCQSIPGHFSVIHSAKQAEQPFSDWLHAGL